MPLPAHFFVGVGGDLFDTRDPDWSKGRPLRPGYASGGEPIHTGLAGLNRIKGVLRHGPYAWPGGYQLYFVTTDGAALSFEAVRERFNDVCQEYLADSSTGWRLSHVAVNYEDADLICDHTGKRIPSAYAEDADEEDEDEEDED